MIKLNREELKDKIYACWLGKNIGGTLGTPFEGKRQVNDVKGFNSDPGNPLPNDDLDLQLIWLKAITENGPQKLNERILGEYWLELISPFWNEYGICKGNMQRGLIPPISGQYENEWKHSNGAWIRTEVWACLNPGLVDEAIRYGYMDACVDHGMGEGTYATIFVAALESAAFVIDDIRELINIGLSKIPDTCRFYKFITAAVKAYDDGKTWLEAREIVTKMSLDDPELGWFQAPANVAYAVIGLLYGEGDFKKTVITAVNCGDDTDCTGATVGAILGIMNGTKIIPDDWKEYIGDGLVTIAINLGGCYPRPPKTCTDLTDRIIALHPTMLYNKNVAVVDGETSVPEEDKARFKGRAFADMLAAHSPYSFNMDFVISNVWIDYDRAPDVAPNSEIGVKVMLRNKFRSQKHFALRFILPDGWSVEGKKNLQVKPNDVRATVSKYVIRTGDTVDAKNRVILEISCDGREDVALIPMVFLG